MLIEWRRQISYLHLVKLVICKLLHLNLTIRHLIIGKTWIHDICYLLLIRCWTYPSHECPIIIIVIICLIMNIFCSHCSSSTLILSPSIMAEWFILFMLLSIVSLKYLICLIAHPHPLNCCNYLHIFCNCAIGNNLRCLVIYLTFNSFAF